MKLNGLTPLLASAPQPPRSPSVASEPQVAQPEDRLTRGVCFTSAGQPVYLPENGETMSLGRDARNSWVFDEGDVSRRHAEVVERGGKHYLRDVGSSNGTFLNGQRLEVGKWVEFRPGDDLRLASKASLSRSPQDLPEHLPALALPVEGAALTVGRSPDNMLVMPWPDSSRSHAVIQEKGGQSWLLDRGSLNGTFLNGRKIPSQQWVVLHPGQVVQFGLAPGAAFVASQASEQPPRAASTSEISTLGGLEAAAVLARAEFAPNPSGIRPMGAADCTREFLLEQGLEPRLTFRSGDQKVHLSRPYNLGEGRVACVGYVEDASGKVKVRAFYRSNSQGLWRSASHAGFQGWIGKGKGEESTNLPLELQQHLHVQAESRLKTLDTAAAQQAFYGCLEFGGNSAPEELLSQLGPAREVGGFFQELPGSKLGVPESFALQNPADGPDFQRPGVAYSFEHPLHGRVSASVYPSQNGQLQYLFYQVGEQRSWIAQVEDSQAPLTSWGTRSRPVDSAGLTTPAVEYPQQIPRGYAGASVGSDYADATAFVHRLPLVRSYREHQGLK